MTGTEVEGFRRRLLALRDRLTSNVSHLSDEALEDNGSNLSHVPLHLADLGSDNNIRENTLRLLASESRMLEEIAAALQRIDLGTFGRCEYCHGPILPRARLKELPYTRYCFSCARMLETERT